ncbi:MAG: hypothetical protein L0322_25700, partial [Chloroflexi bacterium]|nr:hypothetical protein [Chloroflexota bacterium]MCI0649181.1 hypothetical protein [Chloroflexota bacterium]
MKSNRLLSFLIILLLPLALLALLALANPAGIATASEPLADDTPEATRLAQISEETGLIASTAAISAACTYDSSYQVYLCPEPRPSPLPQRDPAAAARARQLLQGGSGLLIVPDSTADRVMAFDPTTGDLVDANFIPADPTNLSTPKSAILSASGTAILVSDQVDDVVQEYDLDGNFLGTFAPAGGPNPAILDNILGLALRPNGNLLVTVTGGTNQDSVAEFDTAGNYLGNFIAIGAGGMDGPFDVYQRSADWLVPSINSDDVNRYDLTTGAFIAELALINNFPEQAIGTFTSTNILIANFSGTQEGVVELTAAGGLVGVYNPAAVGGNRGAYDLPNGNILTTNGSGVHEIDRLGNLVETKIGGVSAQYIELIQPPSGAAITLDKTVGADPDVCAVTDPITVPFGTDVTYCYEVTNTGLVTFTLHDLVDSELGTILNAFPYVLAPGASAFLTQTTNITQTTVNTATWTAYNQIPRALGFATASDTATVNVIQPPDIDVNPSSLSSTQGVNVQTTQPLTISNVGGSDLTWTITET